MDSGLVFGVVGPSLYGGYLSFALLAFVGSVLFFSAFRVAFPTGNKKLYAALIFLYPSWVYWPSGMGKDAILALSIGLLAYGAALIVRRGTPIGWLYLAIGLAGASMVRPHVVALLGVGVAAAVTFRPVFGSQRMNPLARVLYVGLAIVLAWVLVSKAVTFLGLEDTSFEASFERYESIQARANRGGSGFDPPSITDPAGVPLAFMTVLFRPFPWEVTSKPALVLSLEGAIFLGLMIWRLGAIKRAILSMRSEPYVVFILVYVILFILVFTTVGNFSLLGRQRLMMLPLLFMLVAHATNKFGPATEPDRAGTANRDGLDQPRLNRTVRT